MRVGFVQTKPRFGDVKQNVRRALAAAERLEADLVVLPELFGTGYLFAGKEQALAFSERARGGATVNAALEFARRTGAHLVGGFPERAGSKLYNSAFLVGPGGLVGVYRKIHLFMNEKKIFEPGKKPAPVWDIGIARVGIMICFDWIFPEVARSLALAGADILCHPANLVLPHCQDAMVTRCLENRVFAVTANRTGAERRAGKHLRFTGRSRIVSPRGEVLAEGSASEPDARAVKIDVLTARDKHVTEANDLFGDRKQSLY